REGHDVFVRADVQGAASIKKAAPGAVLVFISPGPLDELESRIRSRSADDEASIARRLRTAREEMDRRHEFDYDIENAPERLGATVDTLLEIMKVERTRTRDMSALLADGAPG